MDVRIGIAESPQIIEVEMAEDADREAIQAQVQSVLTGEVAVLTLEDRRGKELNIASARVAWVELGTVSDERRIGFGA